MKIRTGFVSNSSTTSFLIYGTYFGGALSLTPEGKILLSSITPPGSEEDEEVERDLVDILEELHLSYWSNDYNSVYVGHSWDDVGDDETGAQFKRRVREEIQRYIDVPDEKFGSHSEAWYD